MIKNIAILTGGDSAEKEISLKSCKAIDNVCKELGYTTTIIEVDGNIADIIPKLENIDFVFIALHGGKGENGIIQGMLDSIQMPYNGAGVLASSLGMEKSVTKQIAASIGINTPKWEIFDDTDQALEESSFEFPIVIKPSADGSTMGLSIVKRQNELQDAVNLAEKYDGKIMFEDYIVGREMTATIIGNKTYPIVEIVPSHGIYDYECKYQKGMSNYFCPADISDEVSKQIQNDALKIFKAIQCSGYARADFILDKNDIPWFLEINTLPGMTETSLVPKSVKAVGIFFNELIQMIINEALIQ